MTESKLTCMIGPPRSGKSTLALQIKEQMEKLGQSCVILSEDSFRQALHGEDWIKTCEGFVRASIDLAALSLLNMGYSVILDDTHTSETNLKRVLRITNDVQFVIVDTPLEICVERATKLGQEKLIPVIRRCCKQLEKIKSVGLNVMVAKLKAELSDEFYCDKGII